MSEPFLIRDVYSKQIVEKIASTIKSVYTSFNQKGFLDAIIPHLQEQTYSERKSSITKALINYLPADYEESVDILLKVLPPPYIEDTIQGTVDRFYVSTFTAYIGIKGLDHFECSMQALYEMTKCFTAEWDIRPFLLRYPTQTLAQLKKWAKDKNPHVRRFVSEGSRPNLPWGKKLKFIDANPAETTLPILKILQDDTSEYVRRSVANHLNDLSKNNPDLVVNVLGRWKTKNLSTDKKRMIHHALRTLIKQGHQGALAIIGYDDDFELDISCLTFKDKVKWKDNFSFEYTVKNKRATSKKLLIDYGIGFQKKDGRIATKIFKLKKIEIGPHASISRSKSFSFKPITTRTYYPGEHHFQLQINGKIVATNTFELLKT
ncbi:MAG: DNA alkylation repair protein [Saprospiraceae bacterium]|nr:DNA alkylation repair protein [Saprospiraceae bacterium]